MFLMGRAGIRGSGGGVLLGVVNALDIGGLEGGEVGQLGGPPVFRGGPWRAGGGESEDVPGCHER